MILHFDGLFKDVYFNNLSLSFTFYQLTISIKCAALLLIKQLTLKKDKTNAQGWQVTRYL